MHEVFATEGFSKTVKLRFFYGLHYQGLYFFRIKDSIRCCKGTKDTDVSFSVHLE